MHLHCIQCLTLQLLSLTEAESNALGERKDPGYILHTKDKSGTQI